MLQHSRNMQAQEWLDGCTRVTVPYDDNWIATACNHFSLSLPAALQLKLIVRHQLLLAIEEQDLPLQIELSTNTCSDVLSHNCTTHPVSTSLDVLVDMRHSKAIDV